MNTDLLLSMYVKCVLSTDFIDKLLNKFLIQHIEEWDTLIWTVTFCFFFILVFFYIYWDSLSLFVISFYLINPLQHLIKVEASKSWTSVPYPSIITIYNYMYVLYFYSIWKFRRHCIINKCRQRLLKFKTKRPEWKGGTRIQGIYNTEMSFHYKGVFIPLPEHWQD